MKAIILCMLVSSCVTPKIEFASDAIYLPDVFQDGSAVTETYITTDKKGATLMFRKGEDLKGNCIISRTPLIESKNTYLMRINGLTETCIGNNCTHCGFKSTGGCECVENRLSICNHTITKNRDLLRLK